MPTFSSKIEKMQEGLEVAQEALEAGVPKDQLLKFLELSKDEQQEAIKYLNYLEEKGTARL